MAPTSDHKNTNICQVVSHTTVKRMMWIRILHKSRVFLIVQDFDAKNVAVAACVWQWKPRTS